MTTRIIPEQAIKTCDRCGVQMNRENSRMDAVVSANTDLCDAHGVAVAGDRRSWDLCDSCFPVVNQAIRLALVSGQRP